MSLADAIEGGRWASHHYAQITTGTGCAGWVDGTPGHTIEDAVRAVGAAVKKENPAALVGMYWRTDFALELAECSDFSAEWNKCVFLFVRSECGRGCHFNLLRSSVHRISIPQLCCAVSLLCAHSLVLSPLSLIRCLFRSQRHPEWRLRDDKGVVIDKNFIDYSQPAAAEFFANVTLATLASGELDYVYFDGVRVLPTRGATLSLVHRPPPAIHATRQPKAMSVS